MSRRLKTLFKIVTLAMLALWLPATLHCGLEAAGIELLSHLDEQAQSCEDDVCDAIEGGDYGKVAAHQRILPPAAMADVPLLRSFHPLRLIPPGQFFAADDPPEVEVLHRSWSFLRRTALPARAPDCFA